MKRQNNPRQLPIIAKWQHLEYFQWFSVKFNAARNNQLAAQYDGKLTFKTSPIGLGITFHKLRGVELCRRVTGTKHGWKTLSHDSIDFTTVPFASLSERLDYWRRISAALASTDFRTTTALALALNYQPNPIHSSRRP